MSKLRLTMFPQGSLDIHFVDNYQSNRVSFPLIASFNFKPCSNTPHPSFDLPHVIEIRTTLQQISERASDARLLVEPLSSVWPHDELTCLENLERLQVGMYRCLDNDSLRIPMKLADYFKHFTKRYFTWNILDALEEWSESVRGCNGRYELEISLDGFPLDDILRGWKEILEQDRMV